MSQLQARAARRRYPVLQRELPREGRSNEARARPGRGASAASPRRPQVVSAFPAPEYLLDLGPLGVAMRPGYGHRVRDNLLALGTVPVREAAALPGESDYAARAFAQCQRFIALLRRRLGPEPDGARFGVRRSDQEFDPYLEVVMRYDESGAARAYAARCDRDAPARWDT